MEVVRKITVKIVNGGTRPDGFTAEDKTGAKRLVMTVIGRASKAEESASQLPSGEPSPYIRFKGQFAAWKGAMGEGTEFRSGAAILPNVAADFLAGSLAGEETQSVDFAFSIGVKKSDTPTGYEYYCEPLVQEAEDTDPLRAIQAKAVEAQKRLAAPAGKGKAA